MYTAFSQVLIFYLTLLAFSIFGIFQKQIHTPEVNQLAHLLPIDVSCFSTQRYCPKPNKVLPPTHLTNYQTPIRSILNERPSTPIQQPRNARPLDYPSTSTLCSLTNFTKKAWGSRLFLRCATERFKSRLSNESSVLPATRSEPRVVVPRLSSSAT